MYVCRYSLNVEEKLFAYLDLTFMPFMYVCMYVRCVAQDDNNATYIAQDPLSAMHEERNLLWKEMIRRLKISIQLVHACAIIVLLFVESITPHTSFGK